MNYKYNFLRKFLKVLPKTKIEIIPYDLKDQQIAKNMSILINLSNEYCFICKNEIVACVCMEIDDE